MRRQRFCVHSALGAAVPDARFYLSTSGSRNVEPASARFADDDSAATVAADEASYLELGLAAEQEEPTLVEAPADPLALEPDAREVPLVPGYVLEAVLGDGASARVYRARHAASRRVVAIKLMHSFLVDDEVAQARFLREGELLARVRHPNIVEVHEVGRLGDGRAYLAMELVTGPTLKGLLAGEGPMPPTRVLGFLKQVAQALVTVHAAGIVHRDLKLTNVAVVGPKGQERLKLLDFGLVHQADQEGTRLTKVGVLLGSPAFMPPEQIEAPSSADQRADLYALGIMAYALLTGRVPFHGDKLDILRAQIGADVPKLPDLGGLGQVVHQLLHKDPALRTPTASHLLRQLQQLIPRPSRPPIAPPPASSSSTSSARPTRRRPPKRDLILLSFALLFTLVSAAGVGGQLWLDEREGVLAYRGVHPGTPADEPVVAVCMDSPDRPLSVAPLAMSLVDAKTEPSPQRASLAPAPGSADQGVESAPTLQPAAIERLATVLEALRELTRRSDVHLAVEDL